MVGEGRERARHESTRTGDQKPRGQRSGSSGRTRSILVLTSVATLFDVENTSGVCEEEEERRKSRFSFYSQVLPVSHASRRRTMRLARSRRPARRRLIKLPLTMFFSAGVCQQPPPPGGQGPRGRRSRKSGGGGRGKLDKNPPAGGVKQETDYFR